MVCVSLLCEMRPSARHDLKRLKRNEDAAFIDITSNQDKEHANPHSGWTAEYWNRFYANEEGKRYFVAKPETPESTRMFLLAEGVKRRMVFLTVDAEESFFDFPGKE